MVESEGWSVVISKLVLIVAIVLIARFCLQSLVSTFPSLTLDIIALFYDTIAKKYHLNLTIVLRKY